MRGGMDGNSQFLGVLRAVRTSLGPEGAGPEGFARAISVTCKTLDLCPHCLAGKGTVLNTRSGRLETCPSCRGVGAYHQNEP